MRFRTVAGPALMLISALIAPIVIQGCSDNDDNDKPGSNGASTASDSKATGRTTNEESEVILEDVCRDWPKPAAILAVTGQVYGYLEPCGCSEPQYGGISRRADLLRQLSEREWPLVPLDLGSTLKRTRDQSRHKFDVLQAAHKDMEYAATTLGVTELRQGLDWLLSELVQEDSTPFVSSNIRVLDDPEFSPKPWLIVERNGLKIGITAVFGPKLVSKVGNLDENVEVLEPVESLTRASTAMKDEGADLLVLLSHATPGETEQFARDLPQFPLILATGPSTDPLSNNPQTIEKSTVIHVGHKGRYVGLVGFYPDAEAPFRFELVRLDGGRFEDAPRMLDHMRYYQDLLRDEKLAERDTDETAVVHKSEAAFVGSLRCEECHRRAFDKWKSTDHAAGFDSLREGRRGISRVYDPECLSCHVTGWHPHEVFRYRTGYLNEESSSHLLGNGCENCHGPGSRHIELVEAGQLEEALPLMKVTKEQAKTKLCYTCHDLDNSPHFKWEEYWPRIAHPWRD